MYDQLEGVANSGMAIEVFKEALAPETTTERKAEIGLRLLDYCPLDSLGLVGLWEMSVGASNAPERGSE